jgi:hypothetical protein
VFDYTYDTNNFFPAGSQQRATLDAAGRTFSDRFLDDLSAITPGGQNSWAATFPHPATGVAQSLNNPTIPGNTVLILAGGRDLPGLGAGGPGGHQASGVQSWFDTIRARGEPGALADPPTDFARWGGTLTFDTSPANPWNFSAAGPVGGHNDFFSVAVHELAHALGVGPARSWLNHVDAANQFTGPAATAANGGTPPPLAAEREPSHWAPGTNSTVGGVAQQAAMTPSITVGTRKFFTTLDFAGMDDLGWDLAAPGDANGDGAVDVTDLGILATNFNQSSPTRRFGLGDFNYSGMIDVTDLGMLATNFNTGAAGPSFAEALAAYPSLAAAAPEPAGIALLALGSACLLARQLSRR